MVASWRRLPTGFVEGDDEFSAGWIHYFSSGRKHAFDCKSVEQTITLLWRKKSPLRRYWLQLPDRHAHFSLISRVEGSGPYASLVQYDTPLQKLCPVKRH